MENNKRFLKVDFDSGNENQIDNPLRRGFINKTLKLIGPLSLLMASPVMAFDLFKVIDPKGKNKDLQKAKQIFKGTGDILSSRKEIDYKSEFAIGESLALEGFKRYGLPIQDKQLLKYVNLVGNSVARNSTRSTIPYYFVVVKSPLYNAFACPGGIIFISSTLVKNLNSEAELACVLAHEVSHVTHRHALQTIKRAKLFEGVSKISAATMKGKDAKNFSNIIGGLQDVLFEKGLDKNMEFEADLSGMALAYRTGYAPSAFINVLSMLQSMEKTADKKGSWYSTHPPLTDRIKKCRDKMKSYKDTNDLAVLNGRFKAYKTRL